MNDPLPCSCDAIMTAVQGLRAGIQARHQLFLRTHLRRVAAAMSTQPPTSEFRVPVPWGVIAGQGTIESGVNFFSSITVRPCLLALALDIKWISFDYHYKPGIHLIGAKLNTNRKSIALNCHLSGVGRCLVGETCLDSNSRLARQQRFLQWPSASFQKERAPPALHRPARDEVLTSIIWAVISGKLKWTVFWLEDTFPVIMMMLYHLLRNLLWLATSYSSFTIIIDIATSAKGIMVYYYTPAQGIMGLMQPPRASGTSQRDLPGAQGGGIKPMSLRDGV